MRAKKITIIISFMFMMVSAMCSIALNFYYEEYFWSNFLLAIFGSGFLVFVISIVEYNCERRINLEKFYIDISKIAEKIKDVECFYTFEPSNLIFNCLAEEYFNVHINLEERNTKKRKEKAKEELIKYFESTDMGIYREQSESSIYYESRYNDAIGSYHKMINKVLNCFEQVANINLDKLDWDYGQLHFFLKHNRIKKMIYDDLYKQVKESILNVRITFFNRNIEKNKMNFHTIYKLCIEPLCETWFEIKRIDNENVRSVSVTPVIYFNLIENNEKLRCKIYHEKYVEQERYIKYSKIQEK